MKLQLIKKKIFNGIPLQMKSAFLLLSLLDPGRHISKTTGSYIKWRRFRDWCFWWIYRL